MIVKKLFVVLSFLSVSWFCIVSGAPSPSYSKVYVRRNEEATPVEYVNYEYGAPALPISAPLTSASVLPCVSPCVVPGQSVAAVAPLNAKIVYNSPISNVPVILPPNNDDKLSYEYSYVVYDDNSGDHKQQRELSDGSVVHGQYSLIQPDGYVREVKYTADDVKGFNAVVRNFLPSHSGEKKEESREKSNEVTPCGEIKNEALTKKSGESSESTESGEKEHSEKQSPEKQSHEKSSHENGSSEKESHEKGSHEKESHEKGSHEKGSHEKESHEKGSHEKSHEKKESHEKGSHEKSHEKKESHEKEHKGQEKLHDEENSDSESNEKGASKQEESSSSESGDASSEEDSSLSSKKGECEENKSKNVIENHHSKEHKKAELKSTQSSEEKSSEPEEESSEEKEKSEEARSAELIPHGNHQPEHEQHHLTHETSAPAYSDLIRCVQSYMEKRKRAGHGVGSNSPLAYVLLPSGPC